MPAYQDLTVPTTSANGPRYPFQGGWAVAAAYGTWGGATVKLQVSFNALSTSAAWYTVKDTAGTDIELTANEYRTVALPENSQCFVRTNVTGATTGTALNVRLGYGFAATSGRYQTHGINT